MGVSEVTFRVSNDRRPWHGIGLEAYDMTSSSSPR